MLPRFPKCSVLFSDFLNRVRNKSKLYTKTDLVTSFSSTDLERHIRACMCPQDLSTKPEPNRLRISLNLFELRTKKLLVPAGRLPF